MLANEPSMIQVSVDKLCHKNADPKMRLGGQEILPEAQGKRQNDTNEMKNSWTLSRPDGHGYQSLHRARATQRCEKISGGAGGGGEARSRNVGQARLPGPRAPGMDVIPDSGRTNPRGYKFLSTENCRKKENPKMRPGGWEIKKTKKRTLLRLDGHLYQSHLRNVVTTAAACGPLGLLFASRAFAPGALPPHRVPAGRTRLHEGDAGPRGG